MNFVLSTFYSAFKKVFQQLNCCSAAGWTFHFALGQNFSHDFLFSLTALLMNIFIWLEVSPPPANGCHYRLGILPLIARPGGRCKEQEQFKLKIFGSVIWRGRQNHVSRLIGQKTRGKKLFRRFFVPLIWWRTFWACKLNVVKSRCWGRGWAEFSLIWLHDDENEFKNWNAFYL